MQQMHPLLQPGIYRNLWDLTQKSPTTFEASAPPYPSWGRMFGGVFVAQSLAAGLQFIMGLDTSLSRDTILNSAPNFYLHQHQSQFLRTGRENIPVTYKVTILKRSKAFISLRVDAYQIQPSREVKQVEQPTGQSKTSTGVDNSQISTTGSVSTSSGGSGGDTPNGAAAINQIGNTIINDDTDKSIIMEEKLCFVSQQSFVSSSERHNISHYTSSIDFSSLPAPSTVPYLIDLYAQAIADPNIPSNFKPYLYSRASTQPCFFKMLDSRSILEQFPNTKTQPSAPRQLAYIKLSQDIPSAFDFGVLSTKYHHNDNEHNHLLIDSTNQSPLHAFSQDVSTKSNIMSHNNPTNHTQHVTSATRSSPHSSSRRSNRSNQQSSVNTLTDYQGDHKTITTTTNVSNNQPNTQVPTSSALQIWCTHVILAFLSDYGMIGTALKPLQIDQFPTNLQVASLNHNITLLEPIFDIGKQWILTDMKTVSLQHGRAQLIGIFYSLQGKPIAYVTQEVLLRFHTESVVHKFPSATMNLNFAKQEQQQQQQQLQLPQTEHNTRENDLSPQAKL